METAAYTCLLILLKMLPADVFGLRANQVRLVCLHLLFTVATITHNH